jgi:hypothetical protein
MSEGEGETRRREAFGNNAILELSWSGVGGSYFEFSSNKKWP